MSLPTVASGAQTRARRWDALILGSGIPALATAARLGMMGQRCLVVEEEAARQRFEALREPFFLAGALDEGLIHHCFHELAISLIDRRRIAEEEISTQILGEDLRIDLGRGELSAEELVAWGICKPDDAHALVRALLEAGDAERKAMLGSALVKLGRRGGRGRSGLGVDGSHLRGLPAEASSPDPMLAPILDAQVRALSNLASVKPGPETQARLLGSILAGGAGFESGPPWLHGLLRRRAEAVFTEFRTLARGFRMVSVLNQPGIEVEGTGELWLGRVLVIAAPPTAIASVLEPKEVPGFLPTRRHVRRRAAIHLRVDRSVIPEGLASRAILVDGPPERRSAEDCITLSLFPRENDRARVDLIARSIVEDPKDVASCEQRMLERVFALLPFSEGHVERRQIPQPRWDTEDWLEDPKLGECWPGEMDLRLNGKPHVTILDRSWVAGLGVEGDLMLGLRAGDALAAELG